MEQQLQIRSGYVPGAVGKITELHAVYYHKHWGFGLFFETKVATELSSLLTRGDTQNNGFWVAETGGKIVGGIAVDGYQEKPGHARLRFFIVSPECQGLGVGHSLMEKAVKFCRKQHFTTLFLTTFDGLDAARHLYEKWGFRLVQEEDDSTWGVTLREQRFECSL